MTFNNDTALLVFTGCCGWNKCRFYCQGENKNTRNFQCTVYAKSPNYIISYTFSSKSIQRETLFSLFQFGQTNQGSVSQSFGGVGRNVAGEFSFWFCDAMMRSHLMVSLLIFIFFFFWSFPLRLSESIRPQTSVYFCRWG